MTDIVSSARRHCLFVSDLANCAVHRVRPDDGRVTGTWPIAGGAYGLSVSADGDRLLVCSTGTMELIEYDISGDGDDGDPLTRIVLPAECVQPWHGVRLQAAGVRSTTSADPDDGDGGGGGGVLAFCHGGRYWNNEVGRSVNDPLHRVCLLDGDEIKDCHGGKPGSTDDTQVHCDFHCSY